MSVNERLRQIQEIDKQIKQLEDIAKSGNWVGAGFTVDLTVGGKTEHTKGIRVNNISFGVYGGYEKELLLLLQKNLTAARHYRVKSLREEWNELSEYLSTVKE